MLMNPSETLGAGVKNFESDVVASNVLEIFSDLILKWMTDLVELSALKKSFSTSKFSFFVWFQSVCSCDPRSCLIT